MLSLVTFLIELMNLSFFQQHFTELTHVSQGINGVTYWQDRCARQIPKTRESLH